MGKRRTGRELALQFLYQIDIAGIESWQELLEIFWREHKVDRDIEEFSGKLINLIISNKKAIDSEIKKHATNWDLDRIAIVERNILRMSICELFHMDDIPPIVSINEAIDIAKKYGGIDSGKFVNGILDKIRLEKNT